MPTDVNELIRSLIGRIRDKDFGLEFFIEAMSLVVWLLTWLKAGPNVFADKADSLGLLIELHDELGGESVPFSGPITSVLIAMVIKVLISKALEVLAQSGLPEEIIAIIQQILETLQSKV